MNNFKLGLSLETLLLASPQLPTDKAFRIVLLPGELFRIPRRQRLLRVLSGTAWVSREGKDSRVASGEDLRLGKARHNALISDTEGKPLIFEML